MRAGEERRNGVGSRRTAPVFNLFFLYSLWIGFDFYFLHIHVDQKSSDVKYCKHLFKKKLSDLI